MKFLIISRLVTFFVLLFCLLPAWGKVRIIEINNEPSEARNVQLDKIAEELAERFCSKSINQNITSSEQDPANMDYDSIAWKFYDTKIANKKLDDGYDWEKIFWDKVKEFSEFLRFHAELLDSQQDSSDNLSTNILLVSEWCS